MNILLNKLPVLDKGYVAKYDSSCDASKLDALAQTFYKKLSGQFLSDTASLTLLIKCPLFVQLNLSTSGLRISTLPSDSESLEVYLPHPGEIGAPSHEVNRDIAADMERTSAALLMNHKAYQKDGCDRFISQILTPLNTYTTLLVHGMYNDWCRYVSQNNAPSCVAAYLQTINQILRAEWR